MSGPLLWLQNALNRTANDREDDGERDKKHCFSPLQSLYGDSEKVLIKVNSAQRRKTHLISVNELLVHFPDLSQAVPLVPLTEINEDAMDNKSFQRLLHKLGIRPPANEQVCLCVCIF